MRDLTPEIENLMHAAAITQGIGIVHLFDCATLARLHAEKASHRLLGRALLHFAYANDLPQNEELMAPVRAIAGVLAKEHLRSMPQISYMVEPDQILLADLASGGTLLAGSLRAVQALKIVGTTSFRTDDFVDINPMILLTAHGIVALDALRDTRADYEGPAILYRIGLSPYDDIDDTLIDYGLTRFQSTSAAEAFLTQSFEDKDQALAALQEMIADRASEVARLKAAAEARRAEAQPS